MPHLPFRILSRDSLMGKTRINYNLNIGCIHTHTPFPTSLISVANLEGRVPISDEEDNILKQPGHVRAQISLGTRWGV